MIVLSISVLIITFLIIAALHLYWLFGGNKWLDKVLPTNIEGERILNPKKIETLIVTSTLFCFAFFYSLKLGFFNFELPELLLKYTGWIIPSIFILRAIGDFKYIGFFKKIKSTEFGKLDTKYFSYISLCIGLIGFVIEIA